MLDSLHGPWLPVAALLLVAVAVWRGSRPKSAELWWVGVVVVAAAAARLVWGLWGPLHVNGQGPLWIRGALDPDALPFYGPGYFELFGWVTHFSSLGVAPDRGVFAANALLSALAPGLLYITARLTGVPRGGALAAAVVLAADPVSVRTAASEGYFTALIVLVLGVQASLALGVQSDLRRDWLAGGLAVVAAGLLAAAAARIHPMAYLPLALCPLVVLGAAQPDGWRPRLGRTVMAAAVIGAAVTLTSVRTIITTLHASQVVGHAFTGLTPRDVLLLLAMFAFVVCAHRWMRPPWLPLVGVASLLLMLATEDGFQQHPVWKLCYQRMFWPAMLLGAAPLLPRRLQAPRWALAVAAAVGAVLFVPALPYLAQPTTEQLEYGFLREALRDAPLDCMLAGVMRAGKRLWEIPSYLVPTRGSRGAGTPRSVESPSDLDAVGAADCLLYVRSSACTSIEARALCESVEREARLDRLASRVFPATPSYTGLPYDRAEVEVVVFRAHGHGVATTSGQAAVSDGAAITPAFAQALYDRVGPLRESDGCRLVRFDTSRFRITVGLQTRSGAEHALELATDRGGAGRRVGDWALAVPAELERDCGSTLAAIERVLLETSSPPSGSWGANQFRSALSEALFPEDWSGGPEGSELLPSNYALLAAEFVLLMLGSLHILYREVRAQRPSPSAMLALALVWGVALALRLGLSPRTFLHEYYHIAETISGYLTGNIAPAYGKTGPALFRLVGAVLRRPEDIQVIFVTNAVIASLAIPAVALLDLALMRSWPRALCAAVLLCVLPQHLRFSAAEDLFVQAVTFGMWALVLFVLYLRTRRLEDVLVAALALSLAMQTRPEMIFFPAVLVALVLLTEPRSWRLLFAWRTLLALVVLAALLVPRFLDLSRALHDAPTPTAALPSLLFYLDRLVLLQAPVTPRVYWAFLAVGLVWGMLRKPGVLVWVIVLFVGYTLFSLSLFSNPPYDLRSQLLPTSFLVLIAAGAASAWMELWGRRRLALGVGACVLAGVGAVVVLTSKGFITELRDQQLEWAFLERTVPRLPERLTLLAAAEVGGHNLDAFPEFLLQRARKTYQMVDIRRAANGDAEWPAAGEDLVYYQGMFCYFAFADEPLPDPMAAPCKAIYERYVVEPLDVEDLDTQGYSLMRYARDGQGPFRIGFYRLKAAR